MLFRQKRFRRSLILILSTIFAGFGAWWWFSKSSSPIQVAVIELAPRNVVRTLAVTGRVRPPIVVQVRSRVAGQILEFRVREGDRVAERDVLAILDSRRVRAIRDQAQAALAAREAELAQARRDLSRAESLRMNGTGTIVALESSQTNVRRAEEDISRLRAVMRETEAQLEEFIVRAPVSGLVSQRPVDPGQVVATDTTLLRLDGEGRAWVEAEVDELYAASIRPGMLAVMAEAGRIGASLLRGEVISIAPRADPATGSRLVRILPSSDTLWVPGQSVDVTIEVASHPDAITLPRGSLLDIRTAPIVLILNEGRAESRSVRPLDWPGSQILIEEGVRTGDIVIRDPRGITPGMEVRRAP